MHFTSKKKKKLLLENLYAYDAFFADINARKTFSCTISLLSETSIRKSKSLKENLRMISLREGHIISENRKSFLFSSVSLNS